MFRFTAILLSTLLSISTHADPVKDAVAAELAFIKRIFTTGYAPKEWKKQQFNWDLDAEYQRSLSTLASKAEITPQVYRGIISSFLASTHDYHVGFSFF